MNKFINIRGPNASGKSTIMMNIINHLRSLPSITETKIIVETPDRFRHMAHSFQGGRKPILIIGKYGNFGGGADTISWKGSQEQITEFIRNNISTHHILLEGIIASQSPRYLTLGQELKLRGYQPHYYSINIEFTECLKRIDVRRTVTALRRNQEVRSKPLDIQLLHKFYNQVRTKNRLAEELGLLLTYVQVEECAELHRVILKELED